MSLFAVGGIVGIDGIGFAGKTGGIGFDGGRVVIELGVGVLAGGVCGIADAVAMTIGVLTADVLGLAVGEFCDPMACVI